MTPTSGMTFEGFQDAAAWILSKRQLERRLGHHRVFMKTANPRKHGHKKAQGIVRPTGGNPPGAYRRRESCDRPPIFCAFLWLKFRGPSAAFSIRPFGFNHLRSS
jgi:hypothetical protein